MEKGVSRIEGAQDFIRDLLLKLPTDGELSWSSEALLENGDVELEFSVVLFERQSRGKILYLRALCHFCPSGFCAIRIIGKNTEDPFATAFFRDEGGIRRYEIHEPQGHTKEGLYPLNFS